MSCKIFVNYFSHPSPYLNVRASTSVDAKSYKIEKIKPLILHILTQKNTHINGCKIVHKCPSATITVHICTVTIILAFNILPFFLSPPHSLFFSLD